jgi:5-methylcytosine-specific restriction endonuclease McrA
MSEARQCSRCGESLPLTGEYFGHTPTGGFRSYCRRCKNIQTAEWQRANRWSDRKKWTKQNAARAGAADSYSHADVDQIRALLADRCAYCGKPLNGGGEIDHMIPLDRGGSHSPSNVTLACMPCNRAKGNRTPQEYLDYRQRRGLMVRSSSRG